MKRQPITRPSNRRSALGYSLVEALVYIAVLATILGVGFAAVNRIWSISAQIRRESDDLRAVLATGERWRDDIRQSQGAIRSEREGEYQVLIVSRGATNEVQWAFDGSRVLRREGADAPWSPMLSRVRHAEARAELRHDIPTWRWDVEFEPVSRKARFQRAFSFVAVARPLQR